MLSSFVFANFKHNESINITSLTPADGNCKEGIRWIWNFLGQCVINFKGYISVTFGLVSLFLCIVTILPQIIKNFQRGLPDQAVSLYFILFWLFGDLSNLIGCILTHQLVIQVSNLI